MTQLFNNEYFGIGLIITIIFLTILFVIVLVMALKDAKRSKEKESVNKVKDTSNQEFAFKEESPDIKLEVPTNEEVVTIKPTPIEEPETNLSENEEVKAEEEFKTADFSFDKSVDDEIKVDNEPTVKIDFDALAASLKNELEKETASENKKPVNELENTSTNPINIDELKKFANELAKDLEDENKPLLDNEEETIKVVPSVNSESKVYLNSEEEKVVKEEKVYGPPVKMKVPEMVMPKFASAPADSVKVSQVEPVENQKEEPTAPTFKNIENETFTLK